MNIPTSGRLEIPPGMQDKDVERVSSLLLGMSNDVSATRACMLKQAAAMLEYFSARRKLDALTPTVCPEFKGTGNHWTVFNGAGAVVSDNMPVDVVREYLTPERFARRWMAAYTVLVRTPEDLAAIEPLASSALAGGATTVSPASEVTRPDQTEGINGLTEEETSSTASVMGLVSNTDTATGEKQ